MEVVSGIVCLAGWCRRLVYNRLGTTIGGRTSVSDLGSSIETFV